MYFYAGLKSRERRFHGVSILRSANGQILMDMMQPVVLRFQMSWWRRNESELESERDSVKHRMFSLSDVFHFQQRTQEETNPCRVQLEPHITSSEPNSSQVSRDTCLAFFSYFKPFFFTFQIFYFVMRVQLPFIFCNFFLLRMHFKKHFLVLNKLELLQLTVSTQLIGWKIKYKLFSG